MGAINTRINRGVTWLDDYCGTQWVWEVDLDELNMGLGDVCVLSQATGVCYRDRPAMMHNDNTAINHAFNRWDGVSYGELTKAWIKRIEHLRTLRPKAKEVAPQPAASQETTVDSIMQHYAERMQKMYDERTAGDNSMIGLLAIYTMDLKAFESTGKTQFM